MVWWLFGNKQELERVEEDTRKGFEGVKKDIQSVSGWIKHLDSEKNIHSKDILEIKEILSSIQNEIYGLKNVVSMAVEIKPNKMFKTSSPVYAKQTNVYDVQTSVQTSVQTLNLDNFSVTERAILWILLNTDMKLSYDDIATMLGKERSTIRGQLNLIKQKSEGMGLLEEIIEKNGKKRVFINEKMKEKLLKRTKVRVGNIKNNQKDNEK